VLPTYAKAALGRLTTLGEGGQGTVYAVEANPPGRSGPLAYKEYDTTARAQIDVDALTALVGHGSLLGPLADRLAWPCGLVEINGRISGFVMPQVPDRFKVRMRLPNGPADLLCQAQQLLNDDVYLSERRLPLHDQWRLVFLQDVAQALTELHDRDVVVGDLSPANLFASLTSRPSCFFIDCDTMQVRGRVVLQPVETPSWCVPDREQPGTKAADAYKFALLAIRLVAGQQEGQDLSALDGLSAPLARLARLGIGGDPASRPTPADWLPALAAAIPTAPRQLAGQRPVRAGSLPPPVPPPLPPVQPSTRWVAPPAPNPAPVPVMPPRVPTAVRRRSGWGWPVAILIGLLLLCGCMGFLSNNVNLGGSGGGADVDQVSNQQSQVSAVASLLGTSAADRARIADAINEVAGCGDVADGVTAFDLASSGRQSELSQAQSLAVSAIPGGAALRSTLVEALTHSLAADQAFLRWAEGVQTQGCTEAALHSSDLDTANQESAQATAAKRSFVALWNPVAQQYGFATVTEAEI
jgi:hypothetical protein